MRSVEQGGICLTGFYSNYPAAEVLQAIYRFMDEHRLKPLLNAVYDFKNIREACRTLDKGKVNGKIVVKVDDTAEN